MKSNELPLRLGLIHYSTILFYMAYPDVFSDLIVFKNKISNEKQNSKCPEVAPPAKLFLLF